MPIQVKDLEFNSFDEYFEYISAQLGFPGYYQKFKHDTLLNDGLSLHIDYLEMDKHAPNVIVVPGTSVYGLCYSALMIRLFEQGYNVISIDLRGHGQSEGLHGDYTIPELMSDVEACIQYVTNRFNNKITLLGSSQGGIVCLYLAAKGASVQSVICQNFADLTARETLTLTRYQNLFRILKPIVIRFGELMPQTMIPVNTYLELEKIPVKFFGNLRNFIDMDPLVNKSISLRALSSLATCEMPVPMEEVKIPLMLITGDKDSIFPLSYQQALFDKLTCEKEMKIYKDCDHAILHENTEWVIPDIANWLQKIYS